MTARAHQNLYEEVITITERYFGPAADRFVTRQIRNHLSKEPQQLKKQDLVGLIKWISLAMALVSEDELLIHKFVADLEVLTTNRQPGIIT
jgi:uncharacterized protein YegL